MKTKQPTVCAVMLVNGRPEMVERAVRSFGAQTYKNKHLIVLNTGQKVAKPEWFRDEPIIADYWHYAEGGENMTVGALRNVINETAWRNFVCDIICHFDSDDYSHPRRIEEQVALLQESGKKAVGYNEVLFWDSRPGQFCGAWMYSNPNKEYFVGASMMYWREAWEQCKFEEGRDTNGRSLPEDARWWNANHKDCLGISSAELLNDVDRETPRLICEIHGDNTSTSYRDAVRQPPSWKRAPEWEKHCRKVMAI